MTGDNINRLLSQHNDEEDEEDKLFYSDIGEILGGATSVGLLNNIAFTRAGVNNLNKD